MSANLACWCLAVALHSIMACHGLHADTGTDEVIPLPNVPGKILAKVIEYCRFHVEANKKTDDKPKTEDDVKQFDTEFVKVDQATLFDLILVSRLLSAIFCAYTHFSIQVGFTCRGSSELASILEIKWF